MTTATATPTNGNTLNNTDDMSTKDVAKHSSVGKLVDLVDKGVKRNPAMTVGEFWKLHIRPMVMELHEFHIDYTDDAVDDVDAGDGGGDPEYQQALIELSVKAKELILAEMALFMGAFVQLGFVDENGQPVAGVIPPQVADAFAKVQDQIRAWMQRYPELVEETPAAPAQDGSSSAGNTGAVA